MKRKPGQRYFSTVETFCAGPERLKRFLNIPRHFFNRHKPFRVGGTAVAALPFDAVVDVVLLATFFLQQPF
ncbi:MAG: hypothetical protein ABR503_10835 [Chitinophagaceae bacterium]